VFAAAACRHTAAPSIARVEITEPAGTQGGDAAWCGALRPGTRAILRGHVEAAGSDTSDSFAFVATSACTLRCRVRPSLPGADLDLRAVDGATGRRIDVASSEGSASVRIERAGAAIDLVVSAAWGSSSYALDVDAEALGSGPAEEPAVAARVSPARAPLAELVPIDLASGADRGFHLETGLR
jgi:hypothetical protein